LTPAWTWQLEIDTSLHLTVSNLHLAVPWQVEIGTRQFQANPGRAWHFQFDT
jgi:hypothetical protein